MFTEAEYHWKSFFFQKQFTNNNKKKNNNNKNQGHKKKKNGVTVYRSRAQTISIVKHQFNTETE